MSILAEMSLGCCLFLSGGGQVCFCGGRHRSQLAVPVVVVAAAIVLKLIFMVVVVSVLIWCLLFLFYMKLIWNRIK